jgi:hypothetical protein
VFTPLFRDPKPVKFGRPGQAQKGVDVYGHENGNGRLIGIQCKRMDEQDESNHPRPGGVITRKFFDAALQEARDFTPPLDTWILATTAKRDADIQRYALELNERSREAGGFGVQVWFWDDFVTDLNRHHDLQQWYYESVIHIRSPDDQDKIILELLGEAFARAAFRTPLHQETPAEFIQALKDTQHTINTGELKDRETRRVIRKAIGGRRAIADKTAGDHLREADEKLQELRETFQEQLGRNVIRQSGSVLLLPAQLQADLTALRAEAIASVNRALRRAGLQPV